jgi:hypothetical protein
MNEMRSELAVDGQPDDTTEPRIVWPLFGNRPQ